MLNVVIIVVYRFDIKKGPDKVKVTKNRSTLR